MDGDTELSPCGASYSSCSSIGLGPPAAALAVRELPGDGTLVVDNARGRWSSRARGGIIGRFDSGRLIVDDPVEGDGSGPIVYGAERIRELGPHTTLYIGEDVRFRLIGGSYRVTSRPSARTSARSAAALSCSTAAASPSSPAASRSTAAAGSRCRTTDAVHAGHRARAGRRARQGLRQGEAGPVHSARAVILGSSERSRYPDRARGRGRKLDRVVRRPLPEERRLRGQDRRDRRRGARRRVRGDARADRARPDAPGHRRDRGLPPHPQELGRADPDADRARRGRRQDHRPRGRRRRLPDEAVQPARARRPREVDPAPLGAGAPRRSRASRSATATC